MAKVAEARSQAEQDAAALRTSRESIAIQEPASTADAAKKKALLNDIDAAIANREKFIEAVKKYESSSKSSRDAAALESTHKSLKKELIANQVMKLDGGIPKLCQPCLASAAKELNPCRSLGMDSPASRKAFVHDIKTNVYSDPPWSSLNEAQRRQRIQDAINRALPPGHPGVSLPPHDEKSKATFKGPNLQGTHNANTNEIRLRPEFTAGNLPAKPSGPVSTAYHEARHSEQTFLAAVYAVEQNDRHLTAAGKRPLSDDEKTRALIAVGINPKMAKAAVSAGKAKPSPTAGKTACAKTMWMNKFHKSADKPSTHHQRVMKEYNAAKDAYEEAKDKLALLQKTQPRDRAAIDAASEALAKAKIRRDRGYSAGYRLLPHEVDAHDVGDQIAAEYQSDFSGSLKP